MRWMIVIGLITWLGWSGYLYEPDPCWEHRKTVKHLNNAEGVVTREPDWVYITLPSSEQLFPCNLPDAYQTGDSVLFSANQKETFPNERWAGAPIELTRIEHKRDTN